MSTAHEFAAALQRTTPLADPWLDGAPRLAAEPFVVARARHELLAAAAVGLVQAHEELAQWCTREPALAADLLGLSRWQLGMWQCSAPHWHGIARADVFWTDDGARVCELNSDTPSGQAEAVLLSAAALSTEALVAGFVDPNASLRQRFLGLVHANARTLGRTGALTVGIVYPTEMVEDLSLIALYRDWLAHAGHRVVLGAPFNLGRSPCGRAALFDTPCDVVVRHYKTDWFGEREPVRDDEPPVEDRAPLREPLLALLDAAIERRTAIVNPFGAVLTQNKRALALLWELRERFSPATQQAIRRWLPYTARLELVRDEVRQQREHWVLKSDYGCEGDEVVLGPCVDQATWEDALGHALERRWVAQRWFEPSPDRDGLVTNHGVYVVAGAPSGLLLRRHGRSGTDTTACIAPALIGARDELSDITTDGAADEAGR